MDLIVITSGLTGTTKDTDIIKVEICNKCHPYLPSTSKQKKPQEVFLRRLALFARSTYRCGYDFSLKQIDSTANPSSCGIYCNK